MRWDIINHLIKENNYKTYLEIGYYKGWSFDRVECKQKTAVDPNPCKTPDQETSMTYGKDWKHLDYNEEGFIEKTQSIWKMTSDDFFAIKDQYENVRHTYDIIFIDGLHESTQVDRDIENSLKYLSPGGVIVMHDMSPPRELHTTTGDEHGNWNGDCYKSLIRLQHLQGIDFCTIDSDWGVAVIRPNPEIKWIPYHAKMYDGTWDYFDKYRKELLNLISPEEWLASTK